MKAPAPRSLRRSSISLATACAAPQSRCAFDSPRSRFLAQPARRAHGAGGERREPQPAEGLAPVAIADRVRLARRHVEAEVDEALATRRAVQLVAEAAAAGRQSFLGTERALEEVLQHEKSSARVGKGRAWLLDALDGRVAPLFRPARDQLERREEQVRVLGTPGT